MKGIKKWVSNKGLLNAAINASYVYGAVALMICLVFALFKQWWRDIGVAETFVSDIISVALNMVESALFAVFVGNFAVKASQVDPSAAPLEERISTLFNNANISKGAKEHLKKYVGDFATYSPSYELTLEYTDFNSDFNYYNVIVNARRVLISSLKDDLKQVTLLFEIYTDRIENYDDYRALIISHTVDSQDLKDDFVQHPIEIYENHYKEERTYSIHAEERIVIRQKYSLLHAAGESYYVMPQKYTDLLKVRVINKTNSDLIILNMLEKAHITISHGHETIFSLEEQGPERVELFRTVIREN